MCPGSWVVGRRQSRVRQIGLFERAEGAIKSGEAVRERFRVPLVRRPGRLWRFRDGEVGHPLPRGGLSWGVDLRGVPPTRLHVVRQGGRLRTLEFGQRRVLLRLPNRFLRRVPPDNDCYLNGSRFDCLSEPWCGWCEEIQDDCVAVDYFGEDYASWCGDDWLITNPPPG
jgi:hypothetical protein